MIVDTLKNIRKAVANLNPSDVLSIAEKDVFIGLTAQQGERLGAMESFLAPPDLPLEQRLMALRHIFQTDIPGGPQGCDIEIQDEALPAQRGVYGFRFSDPSATVQRIIGDHPGLTLPLARLFPPFRDEARRRIVRRISKENALFSLATALPNIVPSALSLPWAVGEFASDTVVLTANQMRMAFLLAAASGRDVGYFTQKAEMGSIIAGAFGWRALARQLVGKVPLGGGLIPKAAVAYAGTFVIGESIARLYRVGRFLSREERQSEYTSAYARGKQIATALLQSLQRQNRQLRGARRECVSNEGS
jgi:uncharacterized protein (DUF697 family)